MVSSDYYIQDSSDIEDKKLEVARDLYKSGNFSGALKLYLDMVNTSYSYKLYYEIGRCYYKLNDLDNAEVHFLHSIGLEIFKNPSYLLLGNIYYKKQNLSKAIEYWSIAYSYKPDDESVCLNLATSYFSKDMKLQSVFFYKKYLKYAKDKTSNYYKEIQKSMDDFVRLGNDFYQKALKSLAMNDIATAIQALEYAVKNSPMSFDINFLLGKLYFQEKQYMQSLIYLKQAYCLDNKSLDVIERLSAVMLEIGDYTSAYCVLKRILPLIINNQKEYLEVIKTLKQLELSFDSKSYLGHEQWANNYYNENNYYLSLFEFENCIIINNNLSELYEEKIQKIRSFMNPEDRIIKTCFEKGLIFHSTGDFKKSNKYFSRILILAEENSSDYKYARARLVNA
ncbi:tetratricopeptide repeat protein [bacterium]|nr:tetratricopeptide repeat protein [bacterium]